MYMSLTFDMCQIPIFDFLHVSFYLYLVLWSFSKYYTFASEFDFLNEDEKQKRDCINTGSTSFDVRAIMIPCSVKYCPCSNIPGQSCKTPDYTLGTTPEDNYRISNCTKKLVITIKMTDMGVSQCKDEYIVVDHVYDPSSEHKQRLLYPYVLKIKKKPIMQTYKLTRESSVNEKSSELVVNKNDKGYKGCKTTGDDTTCKKVMYKNNPVPYSTGFCCSCDNRSKNIPRKHKKDNEYNKFDLFYTDIPKEEVKRKVDLPLSDLEDFPVLDKFNGTCTESTEYSDKMKLLTSNPILDEVFEHKFEDTSVDEFINLEDFNEDSDRTELLTPIPILDLEHKCDDTSLDESTNLEDISSHLKPKTEAYMEEDFNELNEFGITSEEPPPTDAEQKYDEEESMEKFKEKLRKQFRKHKHRKHKQKPHLKKLKKLIKQIERMEKTKNIPFMHPRGGQDCSNRTCPPGVDPRKYHESTHCLVFSELWYTVYRLEKPAITHELSLEIFEKHEDLTGHVAWKDLTNEKPLTLGTSKTEDIDQFENIWAGYVGVDPAPHAFGIDPVVHRLLVPEPLKPCQERKYPELRGGPREWLVIPNYMITYDGSRCDKVGVGYEAFVKQSNRCDMPRGTCLKNQPKDLWNHDRRMEEAGKPGSYFLKYYGQLPTCPIQNSSNNNGQNLTFYFREPYLSSLHIELKTDYNIVLRPNAAAVITEVYVDGTNYIKSTVTVKVTNSALVYGVYFVALTDCPLDIPASFSNIKTKPALVPPQHQHIFTIEIMSSLPDRKFYCSVEAKNAKNELLSFRRVRFQKNDRCVCIWHCVCTCLETDGGLTCQPLPFDHYTAAGFHGGLPVAADYVQFTLFEELMTLLYHLFLTMTLILILLGVMKAAIGVYFRPIGEWGLCSMLGLPKPIKGYYEESLRDRVVIYDSCGWPIHPDTKKRVRNASLIAEICINCIFFLIYPLVMINVIVKRLCFVDSSDESIKQMCCLCGQKHESGECPSLCILKSFGFHQKTRKSSSHRRLCKDVCTQEHLSEEYDQCNCD